MLFHEIFPAIITFPESHLYIQFFKILQTQSSLYHHFHFLCVFYLAQIQNKLLSFDLLCSFSTLLSTIIFKLRTPSKHIFPCEDCLFKFKTIVILPAIAETESHPKQLRSLTWKNRNSFTTLKLAKAQGAQAINWQAHRSTDQIAIIFI